MSEQQTGGGSDILHGRGEMAAYLFGHDSVRNRRRITALMREVRVADRIPFFSNGGRPASRKSWLDQYALARRQNPAVPQAQSTEGLSAAQSQP